MTLWYGPIGWQSLFWAERKEEKNHFPFAIFNLATPKVVVIYGILRYIKVNSLFMEQFGESLMCFYIFSPNSSNQMHNSFFI